MGEVYAARDTRLGRRVAIKVLPGDVSADSIRLRRFEFEARTASALQHPNIIAVYDVGHEGSIYFIAMELAEGSPLRDLILEGPMPLRKLLDVAVQVADALSAAHEAGILHRDVKPSNVILSSSGLAKLVDFGLAKGIPLGVDLAISRDPTVPVPQSASGAIVGTVEYMSPEQAVGRPLDFRSDQFSYGVLLYEMATGQTPFRRTSTAETLVAILRDEPIALTHVRPTLPPPLRWLVERCLSKVPDERFASTRDLARDLRELRDHLSEIQSGESAERFAGRARRMVSPKVAAAWLSVGLAVASAVFIARSRGTAVPEQAMRFGIWPPHQGTFNFDSSSPAPVAVSPDGLRLVYGARDRNGQTLLWVRNLDQVDPRPLPETEDATYPFWSHDGRSIGFFSDGKLKKIDSSGGFPQVLAEAPNGRGGTWNRDGVILFSPDLQGPLVRVSASGGNSVHATRVAKPEAGETHRWPSFLPDGHHYLYTVNDQGKSLPDGGIYIGDLRSLTGRRLLGETSSAVYAPPGYVLFARDGAILALPFSLGRLQATGGTVPVVDRVSFHPYRWNAVLATSETGVLVYEAGSRISASKLVWFDRSGKRLGVVGEPADNGGLRLSPSGDRCAVEVRDPRSGHIDIWVHDLSRGTATRLPCGGPLCDSPVWSPDGSQLALTSDRNKRWDLFVKTASGSASEEVLSSSEGDKTPTDWLARENTIALTVTGRSQNPQAGIWLYSLTDRQMRAYQTGKRSVRSARFSPDGRWVAYVSDETGRAEIYVSAFPVTEKSWQMSSHGGSQPIWSRNGRELFFLAPDQKLMAAALSEGTAFRFEAAVPLFEVAPKVSASDIPPYDVSPDGYRFLVNMPVDEATVEPLTVVLNWSAALRR